VAIWTGIQWSELVTDKRVAEACSGTPEIERRGVNYAAGGSACRIEWTSRGVHSVLLRDW